MAPPVGHDQVGMQREGAGVLVKHSDPRSGDHFVGRDTPLTETGGDGRDHFQGDPVSGEQRANTPGPHAPANFDMTEGELFGTQADDLEGFAGPNERASHKAKNPESGGGSKNPRQK